MRKLLLMVSLGLVACSPHSDLSEWMTQEKIAARERQVATTKVDLPVNQVYAPAPFSGLNAFNPQRLVLARQSSKGLNAPDMDRPKELLEGFGLDQIQYVGFLENQKSKQAFLKVRDHVYRVKAGNYIGSDYGRIVAIESGRIILEETVEDAKGEWSHRQTELILTAK